jgi:uncharacterized protein YyaL (SSP411 family)
MEPRLPGIDQVDEALTARLHAARPGHAWVNRLALETSPYLLQHAHNPVNWRAWGPEAFERARVDNKLVFISVGYSTCHWCHVMEHESIEDDEVAAFINANFVAVKVDREERPDVDGIYMTAVQMMSGHGGWPMTVFALADQRPVFAGTYYPARDGDRGARMGFLSILRQIAQRYRESPGDFETHAMAVAKQLNTPRRPGGKVPAQAELDAFSSDCQARFDSHWGGFGGGPKFPRPATLEALMRVWRRTRQPIDQHMVVSTLEKMRDGGIHDQVGGGFHRYSVDAFWLVPHFEKMLYDNAQLAIAYTEAAQAFARPDLFEVTRTTLDYLLREMHDPAGGFYSATDADSAAPDGSMEEGWFFTWTGDELVAALGDADATFAAQFFGATADGHLDGRSVLHMPRSWDDWRREVGDVTARVGDIKARLYAARAKRPAPLRDDKIIAAWNGLAISALARAGFYGHAPYLDAARAAAAFVLGAMVVDGRLQRTYREGRARHPGVLDDYAFMTQGLLDLFEATGAQQWIDAAVALQKEQDRLFWDDEGGAYFLSGSDGERLIARDKPDYDGAEPSGNSVSALNLCRLAELADAPEMRGRAERVLSALAFNIEHGRESVPKLLCALDWVWAEPLQIVITGDAGPEREAMGHVLAATYMPNTVRVLATPGLRLPLVNGRPLDGAAAAYVCRGGACDLPVRTAEGLRAILARHP